MRKNQERLNHKSTLSMRQEHLKRPRAAWWLGIAAGLGALAWIAAKPSTPKSRRFSDRDQERRNPMHFFLAGNHPRRRDIDRSGARPLFERRESVYESY